MSANLHPVSAAGHAPAASKHPAISKDQLHAAARSASMFLIAQDEDRLPADIPAALPLADRAVRLAAVLIDALITGSATLALCSALAGETQHMLTLRFALSCIVIFWMLNGWLLARRGQTLGKCMMGIKIATLDDKVPAIGKLFFLRFPTAVVPPFCLASPFFIFRGDRRCLHDLAAGTTVVGDKPAPLPEKH